MLRCLTAKTGVPAVAMAPQRIHIGLPHVEAREGELLEIGARGLRVVGRAGAGRVLQEA